MKLTTARFVQVTITLLLGAAAPRINGEVRPMSLSTVPLPVEGTLPSLQGAVEWLNTKPLSKGDLSGKVVLVEFWTYTCINWRRTLPYVRAWADRYKEQGLVVIGMHTPEFGFEENPDNVRRAVKELGITFPVAIDSEHVIWTAFQNRYWPALYFVDARGRIRHHQFGEGGYQQSERVIQQLLAEIGPGSVSGELVAVDPAGPEAGADWDNLKSPETYLGYERSDSFASADKAVLNKRRGYSARPNLTLNEWALEGDWTVGRDSVVVNAASGRLLYRFHARDVNLIMAPPATGGAIRFQVRIDGQPPQTAHGSDVDNQGNGTVTEPRMYQLIRQTGPITDREIEIQFLEPGAAAFDFTFG